MRRRSIVMVAAMAFCSLWPAAASLAATGAHAAATASATVAGAWGSATEVPGTAALNKGGVAGVISVSCASAGNCGAAGNYADGSGHQQVFVVDEKNGTWGTAREAPGTATLNKGGFASFDSVSCATAGNCGASGFYTDGTGQQAFVVSETNGTWGTAKEVPGTATLNKGGRAAADSVSCAAPGNCSAGGAYLDGSRHGQAFVVSET